MSDHVLRVSFRAEVIDLDNDQPVGRNVDFVKEMSLSTIRQEFKMVGEAISVLCCGLETQALICVNSWSVNMKINLIKAVRELTSVGLKEAKDIVEGNAGLPQGVWMAGKTKEDVDRAYRRLTDAGAVVELKHVNINDYQKVPVIVSRY